MIVSSTSTIGTVLIVQSTLNSMEHVDEALRRDSYPEERCAVRRKETAHFSAFHPHLVDGHEASAMRLSAHCRSWRPVGWSPVVEAKSALRESDNMAKQTCARWVCTLNRVWDWDRWQRAATTSEDFAKE